MQNIIENKYAKIISKHNSQYYIKRKIFLSFGALLILGVLLGIGMFDSVYKGSEYNSDIVTKHFSNVFYGCETFSDYFSAVLRTSVPDIRNVFFIFVSGFTYFCYPASGVMIVAKGFLTGFSSYYLWDVTKMLIGSSNGINNKILVVFVIAKIMLCAISVSLAVSSYIFSYRFRDIKASGSVLRRAPITYKYIFSFITSTGGVLLTNWVYCFIIYLIK